MHELSSSTLPGDPEDVLQARASDWTSRDEKGDTPGEDAGLDLSVFVSDTLPPSAMPNVEPSMRATGVTSSVVVNTGPVMSVEPAPALKPTPELEKPKAVAVLKAEKTPPAPPIDFRKRTTGPKSVPRQEPVRPTPEELSDEPESVADVFAMSAVDEPTPPRGRSGAWWTVPLMCAGLAVIACALLIPAADENRRLAYEMEKIRRDVDYFERQSAVNKDFLERIGNDPSLVERLAQRQLRRPRENTRLIESPAPDDTFAMSPSALVEVDPPAPMPPYHAPVGRIAEWCRDPRKRLYLLGGSLFAVAAGVVLGSAQRTRLETARASHCSTGAA